MLTLQHERRDNLEEDCTCSIPFISLGEVRRQTMIIQVMETAALSKVEQMSQKSQKLKINMAAPAKD